MSVQSRAPHLEMEATGRLADHTASPERDTVRHFGALARLDRPIGPGGVICLAELSLPLAEGVVSGTSDLGNYWDWLAEYSGQYHLAKDIQADVDDLVYAIDDGVVFRRSLNGWDNISGDEYDIIGLLVQHELADGTPYIAVYGHVISSLQPGAPVAAGQQIATSGPRATFDHLHFGIHPGLDIVAPYGWVPLPAVPPYNGFTDPILWIESQDPGSSSIISMAEALTLAPTRTDPSVIYALPNQYGGLPPEESERNFSARFRVRMTRDYVRANGVTCSCSFSIPDFGCPTSL